jgi:hypothetical protein
LTFEKLIINPMMLRRISTLAKLNKAVFFFLFNLLLFQLPDTITVSQEASEPVLAVYISNQSDLAGILAGESGEAFLLYYFPNKGQEQPALVVRLFKETGAVFSTADVFDAPPGNTHVPVEFINGYPALSNDLIATIHMIAYEGWWVRDGLINFNVDIQVYGPVMTMWASGDNSGWANLLVYGEPNAHIIVRDKNGDGLADWDWRTMLPEFPNRGDVRTTYAERKCASPQVVEGGIPASWPFVASSSEYGYEQASGIFRPPIVVSWEDGRIRFFSEIVTLRNQNCSYGLHSIERILPNQINSPDFEAPFVFYDLSGKGIGYPNLILRTGRLILNTDVNNLASEQLEVIRYTWSNKDFGDRSMDYKVEVLGFHPYEFVTSIADNLAFIDAPPYELFPDWIITKNWPVVTFIDSEDINYLTSEGIYEWAPGDLGSDFFLGIIDQGKVDLFGDIRTGLRGEYRLNTDQPIILYMSPVDNRLHLKWAEQGIWRLGDEHVLRVKNIDGDEYIDAWSHELKPLSSDVLAEMSDDESESFILEELYVLDGYLLYANGVNLTMISSNSSPSIFETKPPIDHSTWQTHRTQLAPYESARKDPHNLRSWLDGSGQIEFQLDGAELTGYRYTPDGLRFEIELQPGFTQQGEDLLGVSGLMPGFYLVTYAQGVFQVESLTPPQLSLVLTSQRDEIFPGANLYQVNLTAANQGNQDSPELEVVLTSDCHDEPLEHLRAMVSVPGMGQADWQVVWQPPLDLDCHLTAALYNPEKGLITQTLLDFPAAETSGSTALWVLNTSAQNYLVLSALGILCLLGGLSGLVFWLSGWSRSRILPP